MIRALNKLREAAGILREHGIGGSHKEAEILIAHCTGIGTVEIYRDDPYMSDDQVQAVERLLYRRASREPLSYIIGHEEFMGLKIDVGDGVLIPRPETELMVEHALKKRNAKTILDLCTGSGCVALSLARGIHSSIVYGVDISYVALGYARRNSYLNSIRNASFILSDLFAPFRKRRIFDLIISNPPYIRSGDIVGLQPEISEWEPAAALDGGEDGLKFYRKIIPSARDYLKDGGTLMLELGDGQADDVSDIIEAMGYPDFRIIKDYNGIERILEAEWRS